MLFAYHNHHQGEEDGGEEDAGNDDNEDKFFVPHGYLSEGEGCDDDDEEDVSKKYPLTYFNCFERSLLFIFITTYYY